MLLLLGITIGVFWLINQPVEISFDKVKDELAKSEIPVVIIHTKEEIKDEPKVAAELIIKKKDSILIQHKIGIEYRGKTSYNFSNKKSYAFEFYDENGEEEEVEVLGMPKDEEWNLIGNVVLSMGGDTWDKSLLFNDIGYTLSRQVGRYASRLEYVELVIDNKYLGVYTLGEKLKRGKNRIDIKENKPDSTQMGSFIIAIDKSNPLPSEKKTSNKFDMSEAAHYTASTSFRSSYNVIGEIIKRPPSEKVFDENKSEEIYYNYEYPKSSKITQAQRKYIEEFIFQFETSVLKDSFISGKRAYFDYIDVSSFVDYLLVNELCKNIDGYRLSGFLHKDFGGKLIAGPVWDMNIGFNEGYRLPDDAWVYDYNKYVQGDMWSMPFWWPKLMEDPLFKSEVRNRWKTLRAEDWSDESLMNMVDNKANYLIKNGAIQRNMKKWHSKKTYDYQKSISSLKEFLSKRAKWMDEALR
jgi:hypothetical protein